MVIDIPISKIMTKSDKLVTMTIPGNREALLEAIRKTSLSVYPVVKKDSTILEGVVSRSDLFRNPTETQISLGQQYSTRLLSYSNFRRGQKQIDWSAAQTRKGVRYICPCSLSKNLFSTST